MRKIEVVAPLGITLHAGLVIGGLSKEAISARAASLEPVEGSKGFFRVTAPVQFKRGSVLLIDGDLPKDLVEAREDDAPVSGRAPAPPAIKVSGGKKSGGKKAGGRKAAGKEPAADPPAADPPAADPPAADPPAGDPADQGGGSGAGSGAADTDPDPTA